jgi:hypothetical protein
MARRGFTEQTSNSFLKKLVIGLLALFSGSTTLAFVEPE